MSGASFTQDSTSNKFQFINKNSPATGGGMLVCDNTDGTNTSGVIMNIDTSNKWVAIGTSATVGTGCTGSVAIGDNARATESNQTAIGPTGHKMRVGYIAPYYSTLSIPDDNYIGYTYSFGVTSAVHGIPGNGSPSWAVTNPSGWNAIFKAGVYICEYCFYGYDTGFIKVQCALSPDTTYANKVSETLESSAHMSSIVTTSMGVVTVPTTRRYYVLLQYINTASGGGNINLGAMKAKFTRIA
jgi:hypothetical protein